MCASPWYRPGVGDAVPPCPLHVRPARAGLVMIGALWTAVGSESVKHHAARLFTGAAVFWLAGAAAVMVHRNASVLREQGWPQGLATASRPLQDLPPVAAGAALLAAVTGIVGSALLARSCR